ncbi:hypothetical protein M407DRAFT_28759 [Tulasnella calospora MUT 4182]|uniref:Uncharacterized protein n=1 Tax=Tulasnella calospora MUT 4182 TaxID=1051891 RepID=A0A0C3KJP3_9AGAM|nr:hypothetical protein M407DRAFT_28759 [Tulasnella calospora MUT 4182]
MALEEFPDNSQQRMGCTSYLAIQQTLHRVCSLWNRIIPSSRSFWTTLSCLEVPRKRFKLALSRAEGSELRAVCRRGRYCLRFLAKVLALSDRWESIDVFGKYRMPNMSRPFPNLQRLRIIRGDRSFDLMASFQNIFPCLVELRLEGILTQSVAPLVNLRILALHGDGRIANIPKLLNLIANTENLERMELVGSRLWLVPGSECPSVSGRRLRMFASAMEGEYEDMTALFEYASRHIALVEGNPPVRIDLRQTAEPYFEVRTSDYHTPLRMSVKRQKWPDAWADYRRMLQRLEPVLGGGRMLELGLPSNSSLASEAIRVASAYLPRLNTLGLWGHGGLDLLAKRGADGDLPFLHLSRLRIHGAVDDDTLVWLAANRKADTKRRLSNLSFSMNFLALTAFVD